MSVTLNNPSEVPILLWKLPRLWMEPILPPGESTYGKDCTHSHLLTHIHSDSQAVTDLRHPC